jgi:DNA gyrase/topoisomerase IV subunit B
MDLTALAVKSLVLYSLAEHQAGHARTVRIDVQGRAFSVSDDGRGHAIDRSVEGTPYLALIYEQVRYPFGNGNPASVQLQGIGMSLINALCSELEVLIQRADAGLRLLYAEGHLCAQERIAGRSAQTGNRIRGLINSTLQPIDPNQAELQSWLHAVQQSMPALALYFNGSSLSAGHRSGA